MNIAMLMNSMAREFPKDSFIVLSLTPRTLMASSANLPNLTLYPLRRVGSIELSRAWLGLGGINRIAREVRADVIWAVNLGAYVRPVRPQVLTVNSRFLLSPRPKWSQDPRGPVTSTLLRWCFRRSLAASTVAVAQTPLMADLVLRQRRASWRVAVVPKAVEATDEVASEPLPAAITATIRRDRRFTLLYAATALPHKNHATLLRALAIARRRGVVCRVILTIAAEEVLRIVGSPGHELLNEGMVIPVGWIQKQHLRALYDACDGCVMPSVTESLSSAHLEAMRWNKPQISADVPSARQVCGEASLYASPFDAEHWADKIEILISNPILRTTLAAAGRRVIARYPSTWKDAGRLMRAELINALDAF